MAHPDKSYQEYWINWFKDYLDASVDLGAKYVGSHLGILTYKDNNSKKRNSILSNRVIKNWTIIYEYAKKIAPYTAHIHIGDATGVNGEGLQIGEGEIDFIKLGKILNEGCPTASFIPEIWQGHKNNGEGFWIALEKLKNLL